MLYTRNVIRCAFEMQVSLGENYVVRSSITSATPRWLSYGKDGREYADDSLLKRYAEECSVPKSDRGSDAAAQRRREGKEVIGGWVWAAGQFSGG